MGSHCQLQSQRGSQTRVVTGLNAVECSLAAVRFPCCRSALALPVRVRAVLLDQVFGNVSRPKGLILTVTVVEFDTKFSINFYRRPLPNTPCYCYSVTVTGVHNEFLPRMTL